jgi:EAL domain-containing protein (putative c-di-GMP-specific phosphodiesterase class I)
LDDFGTGYGWLSSLRRLPITGVKVDRSFIAGLLTSPEDRAIAAADAGLGRALGLTTIAEGVETEEQAQAAASLGLDLVQGFLYGHPAGL